MLPMEHCSGQGTAVIVTLSSGLFKTASSCICLTHPSVWTCWEETPQTATSWGCGPVGATIRRCGDLTLSGARSTWQAVQHRMQQSVSRVAKTPGNPNKSGQLVHLSVQSLLSEAFLVLERPLLLTK